MFKMLLTTNSTKMLSNIVRNVGRCMVGVRHMSSSKDNEEKKIMTWSSGDFSITRWSRNQARRKPPHKIPRGPYPHTKIGKDIQPFPYKTPDGGIKYYGFTYYPRYPETFKQEDYKASPLFLVMRGVRSFRGQPYYYRHILQGLGLGTLDKWDTEPNNMVVIKNIPEMNKLLWKVKHLIKITPIKIPKDLPDNADPAHLFLKETGELIYNPKPIPAKELEIDPQMEARKWDLKFIEKEIRRKWVYPIDIKLA